MGLWYGSDGGRGDEVRRVRRQRRHVPSSRGAGGELPDAVDLARPEREIQPAEIVGQHRRWEWFPPRCGGGNYVDLVAAQITGGKERLVHLFYRPRVGLSELPAHRPDRENHRQPGPFTPSLRQVGNE